MGFVLFPIDSSSSSSSASSAHDFFSGLYWMSITGGEASLAGVSGPSLSSTVDASEPWSSSPPLPWGAAVEGEEVRSTVRAGTAGMSTGEVGICEIWRRRM